MKAEMNKTIERYLTVIFISSPYKHSNPLSVLFQPREARALGDLASILKWSLISLFFLLIDFPER